MNRIAVYVQAHDPILRAGVASQLRQRPEVRLVGEDEARVALVVGDTVDEELLRSLKVLRCRPDLRILVISRHVDDAGLIAVMEIGVAGLVRRAEATPDRLLSIIEAAAKGEGCLPPDLLGRLLSQVGSLQRDVLGPRGLSFTGLADREVQVLRLVADGYDTAEIAARLCYSQRTVKSVMHDVTTRLNLRNRSHAVAYALRNGLL
ncbi:helix-turn-helix transcriptional regulator [Planotetraspora kaengkrachanensis]|uniref:helix-turn-helix transcriptional regulator n=1 Tax=Planotetraspora kaengkrachanensis TaxID=575193 RepID=UPI0019448B17|nr:response regulator transcription factor [Planotetraspora kaengkrachanensis]